VVHSGKITTGLDAVRLISSNVRQGEPGFVFWKGGTHPVILIIERRDNCWNPRIGIRETGVLDGTKMLAEPVPVRRPGVCVIGVDERDGEDVSGSDSGIGITKMGL